MDIWDKVKNVIPVGLGFLANAILPGTGGLASSLIADVLGCENNPSVIEKGLVNATQEQMENLRKMAYDHEEKLIEIGLEKDKLYIKDIQSARQREIDITKFTGKKDYNLYILAWSVVLGFFVLVGLMMFQTLPAKNIGPVNQLFGAMATGFGMVLSYFFGSSKSSSDKTKLFINDKVNR